MGREVGHITLTWPVQNPTYPLSRDNAVAGPMRHVSWNSTPRAVQLRTYTTTYLPT